MEVVQCSKTLMSCDRSPRTQGCSVADYPLLHGPKSNASHSPWIHLIRKTAAWHPGMARGPKGDGRVPLWRPTQCLPMAPPHAHGLQG